MALIGPRFAIIVWWLADQTRWEVAFENFWVAFVGFLFLPWTTLSWVLVAPGGVRGFDYVVIGFGILVDLVSYTSGGYTGRNRYQAT